MKLIAITALCLAGAIVSAQDAADNRVHYACVAVTPMKLMKCQTTLGNSNVLKLVAQGGYGSAADFARHAKVGDPWWPAGDGKIALTLAAESIRQEGMIDRLTGQVEIHTTTMGMTADDAVYHSDTGEIEAHGNVRMIPVPQQ